MPVMKSNSPVIRHAVPEDADCLSGLALRSKAHWGYSREFLESCRSELTISPERLLNSDFEYFVAIQDRVAVGFYALEKISSREYELEALFVEPADKIVKVWASRPVVVLC